MKRTFYRDQHVVKQKEAVRKTAGGLIIIQNTAFLDLGRRRRHHYSSGS